MAKDKYSAVWVSHSSIGDYLRCPRAYYLKNVYRDPKNHHKIMIIQPALALGQAVHEVLESLSTLTQAERFSRPLDDVFGSSWKKIEGKRGGFKSLEEEARFFARGKSMLKRVWDNPGILLQKAVKIRHELPYFWLSEEENIILCGKIDWLVYHEETDSVSILDFKTGKYDEDPDSLQLPIYALLATHCQTRRVEGAAYWYLERDISPSSQALPSEVAAHDRVLEIAKRIALARKLGRFVCKKNGGCRDCLPYEAIIAGKGEYVGVNNYRQDIYILE
ncbi:MAG: PD-(D/E)XK nuclease family protein [bacterium]|nr:PD-(D/E)XK nuclease family protein [bacterium]